VVDVLAVHGIGQQQLGPNQILPAWSRALDDGVQFARGRAWPKPTMDLAFYGNLFLRSTQTKSLPARITSDEDFEALDGDSIAFLQQVQDEVIGGAEQLDTGEPSKAFMALPGPLSRLGAWLEDTFGVTGKLLFFSDLVQVRLFQRDPELASRVLDTVTEGLEGRPAVLVGHSLGSVVAYEALCRIEDHGVLTLVTLGSPLGLRSIREGLSDAAQDRIPELPAGVSRWVNIYDPHDPVSLNLALAPHWPGVEDVTVDNERDPHAAVRYLTKKETGEVVVQTLGSGEAQGGGGA
jgi:hypothetical protein